MTTPAATPRKPALLSYRAALWLEHAAPEVVVAFTLWSAWAFLFLAWGADKLAATLTALLVAVLSGWWYSRPGPTRRLTHRRIEDRWVRTCVKHGIYSFSPRLKLTLIPDLQNMHDDRGNVRCDIVMVPNVPFAKLKAKEAEFAAAYGQGKLRSLEILGDDNVRTARLIIKRTVAFDRHTTEPFRYQPGRGIAVKETGEPLEFVVGPAGPNILVAGIKGSGKSGYLNAIIAEAKAAPFPVLLEGCDLKQVELAPWGSAFHHLALTPADALTLLQGVSEEINDRMAMMRQRGIRKWHPGCGFDAMVVVVDELRELVRDWPGEVEREGDQRGGLIASIAALGRFCAVQIVVATQNPLAKHVGEIRQNCDLTICCRVRTETESFTALGDIGRQLRPDRIGKDQQGVAWVVGDDLPFKARAVWLDDHDVARLARGA